ncbi:MAG: FAD:protein FMN transferase [Planctomycetota bacterium]
MSESPAALKLGGAPEADARLLRVGHDAMNTTFEIFAAHDDLDLVGDAARAAFDEVDRIEIDLSRFIETSDVSRVSALRAGEATIVGPDAFDCLRLAGRVHAETGGAFDPTVGALFTAWFAPGGAEREPSVEELGRARARTGLGLLELGLGDLSVRAKEDEVALDLGGIGKGWALDRAAEVLSEWDVLSAVIHSGESTCVAIGPPPGGGAWELKLRDVRGRSGTLGEVHLAGGRAVSGSGVRPDGRHIIDPRTGRPADVRPAAWALAPNAALADALSTAFMVMSEDEVADYCAAHGEVSALLAREGAGGVTLTRFGAADG